MTKKYNMTESDKIQVRIWTPTWKADTAPPSLCRRNLHVCQNMTMKLNPVYIEVLNVVLDKLTYAIYCRLENTNTN